MRREPPPHVGHEAISQEEKMRPEALETCWAGVTFVQCQQLVEEGRSRAPVTNDEQRWFANPRPGRLTIQRHLLHGRQHRVVNANHGGQEYEVASGPMDS